MKQTKEMIKAKAQNLYPITFFSPSGKRVCDNDAEAKQEAFVAGWMQAQQEESEAGKDNPYGYWPQCDVEGCDGVTCNGGGCWRETGYWSVCPKHSQAFRNGEPQPQMKQSAIDREATRLSDGTLPYIPAPVIESPPSVWRNPESIQETYTNAGIDISASVEEKGEGEKEVDSDVDFIKRCQEKFIQSMRIKDEMRRAQQISHEDLHKPYSQLTSPSVKEEDAEGVACSNCGGALSKSGKCPFCETFDRPNSITENIEDVLFKKHSTTYQNPDEFRPSVHALMDKQQFVKALSEYAARDYKSAKGMEVKLPTMEQITDIMKAGEFLSREEDGSTSSACLLTRTMYEAVANKIISEIRRLNDPQGEGR